MTSRLMAPPYSRKTIENFALFVRRELGMGNDLYVPIVYIAENIIPQMDSSYIFDTPYEEEMPDEYANYCPQTNTLSVRQDVYLAACDDDPRHRFTIAHELGHYFLHDESTKFSRCPRNATIPSYRDPEWQANVFASAFLMSREVIKGLSVSEIAASCKTSLQSAEIARKYI